MLITLTLLTVNIVSSKEINTKLMGKVIVIDVGHGGKDKGTSSEDVFESDINLSVALKIKDKLIKEGVNVLLTRDGDYDLSSPDASRRKKSDFDNRIKYINESGADLYLSIHMNFLTDSRYYGAQVFYTEGNERLAKILQKSFKTNLKSPMEEKKLENTIYMFKQLEVPGVLIECGFLSNVNERELLKTDEYQEKIANALVEGLINYY